MMIDTSATSTNTNTNTVSDKLSWMAMGTKLDDDEASQDGLEGKEDFSLTLIEETDDINNDDESVTEILKKKQEARFEQRTWRRERKRLALLRREERITKRGDSSLKFRGRHKWLGGAVDERTGAIYGIPSNYHEIICIQPPPPSSSACLSSSYQKTTDANSTNKQMMTTITTIPLPNFCKEGSFKWLRGIVANKHLYGIPAWSTYGVLKARLDGKGKGPKVTLLPLPDSCTTDLHSDDLNDEIIESDAARRVRNKRNGTSIDRKRWMWHGGAVGGGGGNNVTSCDAIYCIPSNARRVLKVNLRNDDISEIGPDFNTGQNKWYGGIKGRDGCIYGMPYTATGVLRINPITDEVQLLGNFPQGGYKWHGGLMAPSTGVIYAFPAHMNTVLCVDTNSSPPLSAAPMTIKDDEWRVSTIPIKRGPDDTDSDDLQYKWLGGSHGANGHIYGMPSDATSILDIDPVKNLARTFGKVCAQKNKWQGGVLSPIDNSIYAVPADSDVVLRILTPEHDEPRIEFIGKDLPEVEDKWQGGFLARDGKIYGIPENIDHVMELTPGTHPKIRLIK
eukprot:CAMPEP_0184859660 /NCGR_PEP_ID=MMETSP0580-20130426/4646_1 /TAXON_ID=1118495 /ORGANISM="Dactyliosolen fragilissimus" /LENGTH=562 /DNA_ID=CAMNT_0027356431 /DNA_START=32 /DNA_END=1720 /DNA_ORIENTATION=-